MYNLGLMALAIFGGIALFQILILDEAYDPITEEHVDFNMRK